MKTQLLIGAGSDHTKRLAAPDDQEWENLTTLDYNPDHNPDIVHDLNIHPLPFADNSFDEIHAYEVLEHLAFQGDYNFFFKEFSEYYRILKPGGRFFASVPSRDSAWALGDPSHTRIFCPEWLTFLSQAEYETQVGKTPMSDFRSIYKADFKTIHMQDDSEIFVFALEARK